MPPRPRAPKAAAAPPTVDVTAVLVASDGAGWLPDVLTALAASTAQPAQVVCVDAGSTDGSAELLRSAYGGVLELPRGTAFGAAVEAALRTVPPTRWVWLLHDDAAVEPNALEALLAHAAASPSAVLLGPKVRDWADPRVLVEVGLTTDRAGHRETGLDRREYDQGQHDSPRDVLAVGTAGALVRRDVWDELGGLDPMLPVFRDDVDLGWRVNAAGHRVVVVPAARIRHARAATTGRRVLHATSGRPRGIDRRNALFVLLAHAAGPRLLLVLPRLVLAGLLRAVGFLLTRQVAAAADELAALAWVLARPGRLLAARRERARTRTVPPGAIRPLLASRTGRARARLEAVADWLSGGAAPGASPLGALGDPGPDGPDELAELVPAGGGALKRLLLRPGVLLTLSVALIAGVAERAVLPGRGGSLLGGQLLPVPPGARELWASYAAAWHPAAVGTGADAHPATAALALLSTLLLGTSWLAVDLLVLAGPVLAAAVAYAAAGRLTGQRLLRGWAAAAWALLPVATGAVATGRLDGTVAHIALPPLLVAGAGLLRRGRPPWRRAWGLGLSLAVAAAFAPLLWPLVAGLLLVGAAASRSLRRIGAAAVVAVVPAGVLLPWSADLVANPERLLSGPGAPAAVSPAPAWHLLLLHAGGPAEPALWITAGLVVAGLGGLLRRDAHGVALAGWAIALTGFATGAVLQSRGHWPGVALLLAAAGVLAVALVGGNELRSQLARRDFGWRQLAAALAVAGAAVMPASAAASWVSRGADQPLQRARPAVLPAFARAELAATPGLRALVLDPHADGVRYELTAAGSAELGTGDLPPSTSQMAALDAIVADLLAPRGSDAAEALATRAVRYVALPAGPSTARYAAALDAQAGLSRRASGRILLWRVAAPTARLTLLRPGMAAAALRGDRGPSRELLRVAPAVTVPAGRERARAKLPAGPPQRLLVLADAASRGWRASVDGVDLDRRTAWGWAQAFVVPAAGGRLELSYDQGPRHRALAAQALVVVVVLVLAAPGARRRHGLEVADEEREG